MDSDSFINQVKESKNTRAILIFGSVIGGIAIMLLIIWSMLFDTVRSGTYHIKQAAVTGTMSAKMVPGMYILMFGESKVWPKAETYYFTADKDTKDDVHDDHSIEVRFNDGSIANISGTIRIVLPSDSKSAIDLVTTSGYREYRSLRDKLILPLLRNSLRNTANLMSAKESYSTNRSDFVNWSWDQLQNGIYETQEENRRIVDPMSGKKVSRTFKVIKKDKSGNNLRFKNPLSGTGIRLANFEVKQFRYSDAVKKQIETQQRALMAVQTAVAQAKQAEQEKIRVTAEGEKRVEEARLIKEEEKIRAVTDAQKEKEVAETKASQRLAVAKREKETEETKAQKRLSVARYDKQAAEQIKQREILLGQGEAKRKSLVYKADGALQQKLNAWVKAQDYWASAYKERAVPSYYVSGGSKSGTLDNQSQQFMTFMNALMAKHLGLKMNIKQK